MNPIIGNRYKCVVCDDYDLCESCHAAGQYPCAALKHNMMKITNPGYTFPQRLFKRMQVLQERANKKQKKEENKDEENRAPRGGCRGFGPRGRGMFGARGRGMFGPMGPMGPLGQGIWTAQSASALDAMMKGWAGDSSAEANSNPQAKDSTASNDGATSSAHAEAHSAAHAAHSAAHAAHGAHSAAQAAATNDFAAMN